MAKKEKSSNVHNLDKLVKKITYAANIISQTIGLMFSKKNKKQALVFVFKKEKKIPLHMWFVFYPIDVVFLNKDKQIVEIKENFQPFAYYNPKHNAQYIIESPTGFVKKNKIKIGDKISFNKRNS